MPLIVYYVKLFILGSTPRSVYNIKYGLRSVSFGTLFPSTTLLVVISKSYPTFPIRFLTGLLAITYSVISPIINGLAFVTFLFFYMLWKYLFLWQLDQPRSADSGGLFFPKALQHVFVGLYLQQICLAGLFFLAQDENSKPGALPEGILMVILIVFTVSPMLPVTCPNMLTAKTYQAFFQIILNNSYGPLITAIPLSLADQMSAPATARPNDTRKPEEAYIEDNAGSGPDANPPVYEEFAHPASVEPQRVVWIPRDALGLGEMEEQANRAHDVEASMLGARMDGKGHVDVEGAPPSGEARV